MGAGDGEGMLQEQSHCTELRAVELDLSREVGHLCLYFCPSCLIYWKEAGQGCKSEF